MSLTAKFGGEQGGMHPGPLTWPGSGLPMLGPAPAMLRQEEYDQIEHQLFYHARAFRMWEAAELEAYCEIRNRAVNTTGDGLTWFQVHCYDRVFDEKQRGWIVWLEWTQAYAIPPAAPEAPSTPFPSPAPAPPAPPRPPGADPFAGIARAVPGPIPSGARPPADPFRPRR